LKSSQSSRIASAAVIVMSSMVLSRATGFIRETMLSWKVGLSWVQDAYIASFAVPDLMYTLLVGGTISAALIPVLSGYLEKGEEEEGWKSTSIFINIIFS
jgi:putative peptidoglycan lipid II flippase